jgi:hypothetical protein
LLFTASLNQPAGYWKLLLRPPHPVRQPAAYPDADEQQRQAVHGQIDPIARVLFAAGTAFKEVVGLFGVVIVDKGRHLFDLLPQSVDKGGRGTLVEFAQVAAHPGHAFVRRDPFAILRGFMDQPKLFRRHKVGKRFGNVRIGRGFGHQFASAIARTFAAIASPMVLIPNASMRAGTFGRDECTAHSQQNVLRLFSPQPYRVNSAAVFVSDHPQASQRASITSFSHRCRSAIVSSMFL